MPDYEGEFDDGTQWGKYTTVYDDTVDVSKMDLADVDGPSTDVVNSVRFTDAQILSITDFYRSLKVCSRCQCLTKAPVVSCSSYRHRC